MAGSQVNDRFKWLLTTLSLLLGVLFITFVFTGHITAPLDSPLLSRCAILGWFGSCTTYAVFYKLFLIAAYFLILALIIKLPIFLVFGFKSKRRLMLVVKVASITTILYYLFGFIVGSFYVRVGEMAVVLFEVLFLRWRLKSDVPLRKIVLASIIANIIYFFISRVLSAHQLWPLPFFSY